MLDPPMYSMHANLLKKRGSHAELISTGASSFLLIRHVTINYQDVSCSCDPVAAVKCNLFISSSHLSVDSGCRDEDHLALFMELLGRMPKRMSAVGKYAKDYFNRHGELRHIKKMRFWPLDKVLVEKYHLPEDEVCCLKLSCFSQQLFVFCQQLSFAPACWQHNQNLT